jgi:predicted small metal-binding protein
MLTVYILWRHLWPDYTLGVERCEERGRGGTVDKVIECACGHIVRAEDEESLVSEAQQHAREVHGMELSQEQALSMARPV